MNINDALAKEYNRGFADGKASVEQKHGHWEYDDVCECYECSVCKMSALNNWRNKSTNSNYCPHCGAKMRGDNDGN